MELTLVTLITLFGAAAGEGEGARMSRPEARPDTEGFAQRESQLLNVARESQSLSAAVNGESPS